MSPLRLYHLICYALLYSRLSLLTPNQLHWASIPILLGQEVGDASIGGSPLLGSLLYYIEYGKMPV